ncbi:MAG TPA: ribonuclease E inhibitor RraB [Pyrinomonadaceae bacterium]|nr:ribonuclease E inhibitor RraB [Pyrinomonadaceae bacterium]
MSILTAFLTLSLIVLTLAGAGCAQREATLIDNTQKELTYRIFNSLIAQGVDINKPHLYGYYFYDKDKSKLERLAAELVKQDYTLVRLEKNDNDEITLQLEKVEVHSADSHIQREQELRKLASRFSVADYDGWDVGSSDPAKPLITDESFRQFMNSKKGDELFDLGIRLYDLEVNDRAAEVFAECLKQKIKPDVSSFKLAGALLALEKTDDAIFHFEQAVKFNPKYVDAYYNLGAIYYDLGKNQRSLENYEAADKLRPNDDAVVYGIAANQYALGKYSESMASCNRALKINPNNPPAKELREMLNKKRVLN